MEILQAKVVGADDGLLCAKAAGLPIAELLGCDLDVLLDVVVKLATLQAWMRSGFRTPRKATDVAAFLPLAAESLSQWPTRFIELCQDWAAFESRGRRPSAVFQVAFAWLFIHLYKNFGARRNSTRFLVLEGLRFGLRSWRKGPIRIKDSTIELSELPPPRFGGSTDAARAMKVPRYNVFRWLSAGYVPTLPESESVGRWVVDLAAIADLKPSDHPDLVARGAARWLGIPHKTFAALKRMGHLPSKHLTKNRKSHALEDLALFSDSLTARAAPASGIANLAPLTELLNAQLPVSEKVAALLSVQDGTVPAFLPSTKRELSQLRVPASLLRDARSRHEASDQRTQVSAVAKAYDLTYYELMAILHFTVNGRRRWKKARSNSTQDCERVARFLESHIPLRHISRKSGVDARILRPAVEFHSRRSLVVLPAHAGGSYDRGNAKCAFLKRVKLAEVYRLARRLK